MKTCLMYVFGQIALLTKCMIPAAVNQTDIKMEMSWANLGSSFSQAQCSAHF
jgi:hypothetical protein